MEKNPEFPGQRSSASSMAFIIPRVGNFSFKVLPSAPPWPQDDKQTLISYRRVLAAEEWETLKPAIKRLFIDERKTYEQVAQYLRENHTFNPTYACHSTYLT
jgi:hypothetical protein